MLKVRDLWGLIDGKDVKQSECDMAIMYAYVKEKNQILKSYGYWLVKASMLFFLIKFS